MPALAPYALTAPRGRLVVLALMCVAASIMGVVAWLANPTATLNVIAGAAAVGLFGVGGGVSVVRQWRRATVLRASGDGLRITGVTTVPWAEIDTVRGEGDTLGIRLRRFDAVEATGRPQYTRAALRARRADTGWDFSWSTAEIGRPPRDAARDILARRP